MVSDRLIERIASIHKRAQQKERVSVSIAQPENKVVQLPNWPDIVRGVPNVILRSALFGAFKKGARPYLERQEIHAQEGIKIIYTGTRLDQGDLNVWDTVLHIARTHRLGDNCCVTAYKLLKILDKTDSGINRNTLESSLSRMNATAVDVGVGQYSYEGSLIDEVYRNKDTREYVIRLNSKLSTLFAADQFTHIDWSVRRALDGKPLAQWLHGYYASHARPYPVKVATLLKLSGSENVDPYSGRQTLRKALDAVVVAEAAYGQSFKYEIQGDRVHVEKKGSGPQRRHLARKAAIPRARLS